VKIWKDNTPSGGGSLTPIYNPNNEIIDLLNEPGIAFNSSFSVDLPLNDPGSGKQVLNPAIAAGSDLFVGPTYAPNYFYTQGQNNSSFYTTVFYYEVEPIAYNGASCAPGGAPTGAFFHGYLWFNDNGVNRNKSVTNNSTLVNIPKTGDVRFGLEHHQLSVDLVLPEGGSFRFEVYDLMGRAVMSTKDAQTYDQGRHYSKHDLKAKASNIYIIRYTLNGETNSLKLGNIE
jgi:hypothetical protein